MEAIKFGYHARCSALGCQVPARFKIAAPWSDGTSHELKNYGLACDHHKESQLTHAQIRRQGLVVADGETVGTVGLYELTPHCRDTKLHRLPDH